MKKIVLTGPESTGKTSIATFLGNKFDVPVVKEYAVEYLQKTGGKYIYPDLVKIAHGQIENENEISIKGNYPVIICDTDLITIKIWSEVRFNKVSRKITSIISKRHYDLYILCSPDIDWEYADFRENPDDRDYLFDLYENELIKMEKKYIVLRGVGEIRYQNAEKIFKEGLIDF